MEEAHFSESKESGRGKHHEARTLQHSSCSTSHGQINTAAGHVTIMSLFKKENRPGFFCKEDSLLNRKNIR